VKRDGLKNWVAEGRPSSGWEVGEFGLCDINAIVSVGLEKGLLGPEEGESVLPNGAVSGKEGAGSSKRSRKKGGGEA